ncbi:hypothetical protein [Alkalihalobacillus pseudalcaliphilus]|nr:hypothetical protein [Alkalihalobacillus pseudalcaliphilus]
MLLVAFVVLFVTLFAIERKLSTIVEQNQTLIELMQDKEQNK